MLLPPAERRGEIQFVAAKSLPYRARLATAFCLIAAGLAIQVLLTPTGRGVERALRTISPDVLPQLWPFGAGLALVLAGIVMLLTRGYRNKPASGHALCDWRPATRAEAIRIVAINEEQKAWDSDAIDLTCGRGTLTFLGVVALVAVAIAILVSSGAVGSGLLAVMLGANALVMLLPFWITGVRSILKNDQLLTTAQMLLALEDVFNMSDKAYGTEFQYQMRTAKAGNAPGEVPRELKALVQFSEGPPEFLGVQMQISINSVKGSDYPYFYCVLVARPEFGGLTRDRFSAPPRKIVVEPKREGDVDIAVIRQQTSKTSGYHTNQKAANRIFIYALEQARRLLAAG